MNELTIDVALVQNAMPCTLRLEVVGSMLDALATVKADDTMNWGFFGHLKNYAGRVVHLPTELSPAQDLWPPNFAVLDYILKTVAKTDSILDFACGMGNLFVYLNHSGYTNLCGYDNWLQVPRLVAENFLEPYALGDCLADKLPDWTDVLVFTGGHWCWFWDDYANWFTDSRAKCLLVDSAYAPPSIAGFKMVAEYEGLLNVYERN